jgi:hypothetical protein
MAYDCDLYQIIIKDLLLEVHNYFMYKDKTYKNSNPSIFYP